MSYFVFDDRFQFRDVLQVKEPLAEFPGLLFLVQLAEHALDNNGCVFLLSLELVCE